jgi:hypothetical protein
MKSKSLYTLICLAATASLLNACSAGDDATAEQTPQATTVSFSGTASVGTSADATRGYFGDATVGSPLGAYTWESSDVIKAAVYDATATPAKFLASGSDYSWAATVTPTEGNATSAKIYWTQALTDFNAGNTNTHLLFSAPTGTTVDATATKLAVTYNLTPTFTGAAENSLTHLKNYSFIYAQQSAFTGTKSETAMTFTYIPALIRFAIANGNAAPVNIQSVKMTCSTALFPTSAQYSLSSTSTTFAPVSGYTPSSTVADVSVNLTTAATVASGAYTRLYAAVLPTAAFATDATFTFTITTSDGTYTSNKITGAQLAADWKTTNVGSGTDTATDLFRSGKSYTFKLWFDNVKGLTFASSSAMLGWTSETDL